MTEGELESFIMDEKTGRASDKNDARFMLGKMMCEGTNPGVGHNENKGLNYIKEASKAGNMKAIEFKTYFDIRFDRKPNIEKITVNLERIIKECGNSARACNTLAEFNHA